MTQKSLAEWYEETYRKKSPVTTQAVTSVPVTSQPVSPEPIRMEPVKPEPVTTEPEVSGLAAAEPDTLEPLVSEPDAEESVDTAPALFEQLGGSAAVDAAVDIFYRKVLSDDRINRFFGSVDMEKQAVKQKVFSQALSPHIELQINAPRPNSFPRQYPLTEAHPIPPPCPSSRVSVEWRFQ